MTNLLEMVLPMISNIVPASSGEFDVQSLTGQVRNELGVMVPQYGAKRHCHGSVQPVNRSVYADQGLDFEKNYIDVWGSIDVKDLTDKSQPDVILWSGKRFTVVSIDSWNRFNGWMHCRAVEDVRE